MSAARLWARTIRGLEDVTLTEAVIRLGARPVQVGIRDVVFDLDIPVRGMTRLRTADDVFVLAAEFDVAGGHDRPGQIARRIGEHRADLEVASANAMVRSPARFSVSASIHGRHRISRFDLEDAVGHEVATSLGHAYVSRRTTTAGLEFVESMWRVQLRNNKLMIGVRRGAVPLHRRPWKLDSVPGSLHPPVAATIALLGLSAADDGLIVDPTCGAGTIAIEASLWAGQRRVLAADQSATAVGAAQSNADRARARVPVVRGQASAIPVAARAVDAIVANPPWNKQVTTKDFDLRYLFREADRVCADDGILVLLTPTDQLPDSDGWAITNQRAVFVHGRPATITTLQRSSLATSIPVMAARALTTL